MELIAHLKNDKLSDNWIIHSLEEHLDGVARISKSFAEKFGNGDWANVAAMLHDLGKESKEFQKYIKTKSGFERSQAHIENSPGRVIHSTQGADWAYRNWGPVGKIISYLIAGHHSGLPDWDHEIGVGGNLNFRLKLESIRDLPKPSSEFIETVTEELKPPSSLPCNSKMDEKQLHLWIRMLYSCLVDADFLDTEDFMNPEKNRKRGGLLSIPELKNLFDSYMEELTAKSDCSEINKIRKNVLGRCRQESSKDPGLFSLTVPTGGGKTLSSMAFALEHALAYDKERIIMVIPYTSIIEQTAAVYKGIFGKENVIEHHSSLDPDKETMQSRMATENWDAPIIVTTNVQFFESLFSAKSSRCRKLHNIVNSVVIIDEAQMIPTDYLEPILYCIKGLTDYFGTSVVLCTATQPALCNEIFSKGDGSKYAILDKEKCREIMVAPTPNELALSLQRVEIIQIKKKNVEWSFLADLISDNDQALCIVNTRNDCRELHKAMPDGTIHLSANMCAEHRSDAIKSIKERLRDGACVRVISTQLVEAGVDLDFPVVFRAMAGFDSVAQAAGRCNREGKLTEKGKVFVFEPPKEAPRGMLLKGQQSGRTIFTTDPEGCRQLLPKTFTKYFHHYFSDLNTFDKQGILGLLFENANPDLNFQFRSADKRFKLIDGQNQVSIVVRYEGENGSGKQLIAELKSSGPSRELMRRLQRFTISIPNRILEEMNGNLKEINGIWCQEDNEIYDSVLGFVGYRCDDVLMV